MKIFGEQQPTNPDIMPLVNDVSNQPKVMPDHGDVTNDVATEGDGLLVPGGQAMELQKFVNQNKSIAKDAISAVDSERTRESLEYKPEAEQVGESLGQYQPDEGEVTDMVMLTGDPTMGEDTPQQEVVSEADSPMDYEEELNEQDRKDMEKWLKNMELSDEDFWKQTLKDQYFQRGVVMERYVAPDFGDLRDRAITFFVENNPELSAVGVNKRANIVAKMAMRRFADKAGEKIEEVKSDDWQKKHPLAMGIKGIDGVIGSEMRQMYSKAPAKIEKDIFGRLQKIYGEDGLTVKSDEPTQSEAVALHAVDMNTEDDMQWSGGLSLNDLAKELAVAGSPTEVQFKTLEDAVDESILRINKMDDRDPDKQILIEGLAQASEAILKFKALVISVAAKAAKRNGEYDDIQHVSETGLSQVMAATSLGRANELYGSGTRMGIEDIRNNIAEIKSIIAELQRGVVLNTADAYSAPTSEERKEAALRAGQNAELIKQHEFVMGAYKALGKELEENSSEVDEL